MNEKKTLRVGVIGAGNLGNIHLRSYAGYHRAELVAVSDIIDTTLAAATTTYGIKGYKNYQEMLNRDDIDAVSVATPDHLHYQPAIDTLEAGKHLLLEKPMATTLEKAKSIHKTVKTSGKVFMLHMNNRWKADFFHIKELIIDGTIGEPIYAHSYLNNTRAIPDHILPWLRQSHLAHWLVIHRLDLSMWYFDSKVARVYSVARNHREISPEGSPPDVVLSLVEFENGGVVNIETAWTLPNGLPSSCVTTYRINGTKAYIDFDSSRCSTVMATNENFHFLGLSDGVIQGKPYGQLLRSVAHFVDSVLDETPPLITEDHALELTRVCCAIVESAKSERPVTLSEFDQ